MKPGTAAITIVLCVLTWWSAWLLFSTHDVTPLLIGSVVILACGAVLSMIGDRT